MSSPGAVELRTVSDAFSAELEEIALLFATCSEHNSVSGYIKYYPTEEGCLFAIWDAWNRFVRRMILTSVEGETIGTSGVVYQPGNIYTEVSALQHLQANRGRGSSYKFTNGEPNWYVPAAAVEMAQSLGAPNVNAISGALLSSTVVLGPAVVSVPLEEIRISRNFCAHKNWKTMQDLRRFDPNVATLREFLRVKNAGSHRFDDWLDALNAIAEAASS